MNGSFLVFTDLHIHTHKLYARELNGRNSRLDVCLSVLDQILYIANASGIDHVVFAGDLFDVNNRVPVNVMNEALERFARWSASGLSVLMIPGNHDHTVKDGSSHSLEVFKQLDGFLVVDEIGTVDWGGMRVHCVPYREHLEESMFAFSKASDKLNVVVGHGNMEGMANYPHILPEDPRASHGDWIREAWLGGVDLAIFGHVHDYALRKIQQDGGKCTVLVQGCPYQDEPKAEGKDRGISEVSWEVGEGERHCDCYPCFDLKYPRFKSLEFQEKLGVTEEMIADATEGCILRMFPESELIAPHVLNEARQKLYEAGAFYVEIAAPKKKKEATAPRLKLDVESPEKALEKVVLSGLFDIQDLDAGKLIELGVSYIEKAKGIGDG